MWKAESIFCCATRIMIGRFGVIGGCINISLEPSFPGVCFMSR